MSLEAGALSHAGRLGLLARRTPLLRLQGDERLIALMRAGHERAFEALVERYEVRLQAFCRGMLGSSEDAEDVLQEVFVAAHKAILADNRQINARPWLYRIARNRCLNHMRRQTADAQESMDVLPHENGISTAERVEEREELRAVIGDVHELPETQRTALLLREIDAMAYEEIAVAMETTVPAVKSLLVRARMSLADASQGRHLTCDEVHLDLAEAAEGLRKASGPVRAHIRGCARCQAYRKELRRNGKALAALAPIGPLAALHHALAGKLGFGGAKVAAAGSGGTAGAGATTTATSTATLGGAAAAGSGTAVGVAGGGAAAAFGTKAAAGVASVAILTAGAVEMQSIYGGEPAVRPAAIEQSGTAAGGGNGDSVRGGGAHQGSDHADGAPRSPAVAGGEEAAAVAGDEPRETEGSEGESAHQAPATGPDGENTQASGEASADEGGSPPKGGAGEPESGTGSIDPATGGVDEDVLTSDPPAVEPPADGTPPAHVEAPVPAPVVTPAAP